jgi:hypothetical protein
LIRAFTKRIAKDTGYKDEHLLAMTFDEFEKYIEKKVLPSKKVLAERYRGALIIFTKGKFSLEVGKKVINAEMNLAKAFEEKILKGSIAFKGKVIGLVKIIFDPCHRKFCDYIILNWSIKMSNKSTR